MKRIAEVFDRDGNRVGIAHGPDMVNQTITVKGRVWKFDFDKMFGPLWLKADGTTERKCQNPNKSVWDAFEKWHAEITAH